MTIQHSDQPAPTATRCRCICPNGCDCGCTCLVAIELRAEQRARRAADGGPIRIQRKRIPGWRKPEGSVYVGRPTRFGNPYRLVRQGTGWAVQFGEHGGGVGTFPTDVEARRYATEAFRVWMNLPEQADTLRLFRALLHGRDLTCWCPLPAEGEPDHCHGAVLLELVNGATR
jgi:hypothetical protein